MNNLIKYVRLVIRIAVTEKPMENVYVNEEECYGTFVTIKCWDGLRGCIGEFLTEPKSILDSVTRSALRAATQDTRFSPLKESELDNMNVEVTILGKLEKITDINKIELGKDGVLCRHGYHEGTYLPQVATENYWDLQHFVDSCAYEKARIPFDVPLERIDIFKFNTKIIK